MLSHPNATQAPQARQARPSGEILNYLLSHYSDILSMIIAAVRLDYRLKCEDNAFNLLHCLITAIMVIFQYNF